MITLVYSKRVSVRNNLLHSVCTFTFINLDSDRYTYVFTKGVYQKWQSSYIRVAKVVKFQDNKRIKSYAV